MSTNNLQTSEARIKRIREQGYFTQSDREVSDLAFGNRFAYILCSSILTVGIVLANNYILSAMMLIALSTVFLPYHPFDYIYNSLLSKRMNKPKIPPRSPQLKFACGMATAFIAATIYLFNANLMIAGYAVGGSLLVVAFLVSYLDICIPSIIYNALFLRASSKATIKK